MPKPLKNETEKEYIPRCIKVLMDEGKYPQKQCIAICYSMWENKDKSKNESAIDKEPWQMTKKEYQKSKIGKKYKDFLNREQEVSGTDAELRVQGYVHKEYIIQAIARGEKIPKKILAAYPDLMKKKSIVEKINLFLEQGGTVTPYIDVTPTSDRPKKKKKKNDIMRRRLQSDNNLL